MVRQVNHEKIRASPWRRHAGLYSSSILLIVIYSWIGATGIRGFDWNFGLFNLTHVFYMAVAAAAILTFLVYWLRDRLPKYVGTFTILMLLACVPVVAALGVRLAVLSARLLSAGYVAALAFGYIVVEVCIGLLVVIIRDGFKMR